MVERSCLWCKRLFLPNRSRAVCCSRLCGIRWAQSVHATRRRRLTDSTDWGRVCTICSKPFTMPHDRSRLETRRFCSRRCSRHWRDLVGLSPGKYPRVVMPRSPNPTEHPTIRDIAWAAGIYEGEGSAHRPSAQSRSLNVSVSQKDTWLLKRFVALFGGSITIGRTNKCSAWFVSGTRARGFIFTIYSFLSPWRRLQTRRALGYESAS